MFKQGTLCLHVHHMPTWFTSHTGTRGQFQLFAAGAAHHNHICKNQLGQSYSSQICEVSQKHILPCSLWRLPGIFSPAEAGIPSPESKYWHPKEEELKLGTNTLRMVAWMYQIPQVNWQSIKAYAQETRHDIANSGLKVVDIEGLHLCNFK